MDSYLLKHHAVTGLKVNFDVHLQIFACKIFSTSKLVGHVANSLQMFGRRMILNHKRLPVDIFLTRKLSK